MQDTNRQEEIDILDLLYRILLKWRLVLGIALLCCVLTGGLQVYKNHNQVKALEQKTDVNSEMILQNMTVAETNAVKDAVDISMNIDDLKQYMSDSLYMNLNPYHENVVTLCYTVSPIEGGTQCNNQLLQLLNAYSLHINGLSSLDGYDSEEDLTNLFECTSKVKDMNMQSVNNINISTEQDVQPSDTLIIYVKGSSKEMAEELSKALQKDLDAYKAQMDKNIGQHELHLVSEESTTLYDQDLESLLAQEQTKLTTYNTNLGNYMTKFSDVQKSAYTQLLNEKKGLVDETQKDETVRTISLTDNLVKAVVVGFLIGFILVCGLITLRYLTNGLLKQTSDLMNTYNVFVQGDFSILHALTNSKNKIDKRIIGLKNTEHISLENMEDRTVENIKLTINREGLEQVIVTSSFWLDEEDETFVHSLMERVDSGTKLTFLNDFLGNVQALEAGAQAGGIVLVEKMGNTRFQRMDKLMELCREHGIRILGVVVL